MIVTDVEETIVCIVGTTEVTVAKEVERIVIGTVTVDVAVA